MHGLTHAEYRLVLRTSNTKDLDGPVVTSSYGWDNLPESRSAPADPAEHEEVAKVSWHPDMSLAKSWLPKFGFLWESTEIRIPTTIQDDTGNTK